MKTRLILIMMLSFIGMATFAQTGVTYVDLGLSVSWATCNLGASKPEGYGNYYAFGELSEKATFTETNYKYLNKQMVDYSGDPKFDAATYVLGKDWRTPTKQEMQELSILCEWEWIKLNGITGYKVTGPNGNSIFLPAAGCDGTQKRICAGSNGYFRTSSPVEDGKNISSWTLSMDDFAVGVHEYGSRESGFSIRPVHAKLREINNLALGVALYNKTLYEDALPYLRMEAEKGNSVAQFYIGVCYNLGRGVPKSPVTALGWYLKSAEQGVKEAQYNVGYLYSRNGPCSLRDDKEALAWFRKSADQGYADAQRRLGEIYEYGWGPEQSYTDAAFWYRKAADQGHREAQYLLASLYASGKGVEASDKEAAYWFEKSAEQGNPGAQYKLGMYYKLGVGVTQNYTNALTWFRKSAKNHHSDAMCEIGLFYYNGWGVAKDYSEALIWFRKAAAQGNVVSQYHIGACYYAGWGVAQNLDEAVSWLLKAANSGYSDAQYALGVCYEFGHGVVANAESSLNWYRLAARAGNVNAQSRLNALGFSY